MKARIVAAWSAALGLLVIGAVGVAVTYAAWTACAGDQTTELCLRAMDQPSHLGALQLLWLLAVGLCAAAVTVARRGTARLFAASALLLVIMMNYATEYLLWLGFAGGHWDVPPGTGYTQALAYIAAAALSVAAAVLSGRASGVYGRRSSLEREAGARL
ncbi:MAG: hypothetical protein Q7T17_07275 [Microbacterium sp.]|uniref:hypothetical protein n=1 Tax=Microbacterium sp. TaxID=51671 RepID=UPI0027264D5D|nr:hypothetical protein [Microbacterium sp.]MDO8382761.1 hypothetical protein [Microbacterium sp.]